MEKEGADKVRCKTYKGDDTYLIDNGSQRADKKKHHAPEQRERGCSEPPLQKAEKGNGGENQQEGTKSTHGLWRAALNPQGKVEKGGDSWWDDGKENTERLKNHSFHSLSLCVYALFLFEHRFNLRDHSAYAFLAELGQRRGKEHLAEEVGLPENTLTHLAKLFVARSALALAHE